MSICVGLYSLPSSVQLKHLFYHGKGKCVQGTGEIPPMNVSLPRKSRRNKTTCERTWAYVASTKAEFKKSFLGPKRTQRLFSLVLPLPCLNTQGPASLPLRKPCTRVRQSRILARNKPFLPK